MKISKQELKQLIKEEVDFLLREARFELGSPELRGETGGGGEWIHSDASLQDYDARQRLRAQGIEPVIKPFADWDVLDQELKKYGKYANIASGRGGAGWWRPPTSKPGGAPIQHPGIATPRIDPITGQETGGLDIEPPADPIEDPEDWPGLGTRRGVRGKSREKLGRGVHKDQLQPVMQETLMQELEALLNKGK